MYWYVLPNSQAAGFGFDGIKEFFTSPFSDNVHKYI